MTYLEDRAGLRGKVAVVIGGGGGLGRACAVDLAGAGMQVALADRDAAGLESTASAIAADGGSVVTGALDARDPDALAGFFDQVDDRFGPSLHVLVNVVGGTFRQAFTDSVPRGWEALIGANFTWLLHATQMGVARMRPGGGSIINLTSIEAHRAAPRYAVYAAMKAAVTSFTASLAVELAPEGIRVNTIAPDYVPTGALEALVPGDDDGASGLRQRIATPMGRAGTFADVGGCALFLASDLSAFVTGTALHPDGGALAAAGWWNWPGEGFLNHPPAAVLGYLGAEGPPSSDPDLPAPPA